MCHSTRPSHVAARWARSAGISACTSRRYSGSVAATCQPKRSSIPAAVRTWMAGVKRAPHCVNRCATSIDAMPTSRQIASQRSRWVKSKLYPPSAP